LAVFKRKLKFDYPQRSHCKASDGAEEGHGDREVDVAVEHGGPEVGGSTAGTRTQKQKS